MQTVIVLPYKRVNGLCTSLSRGEQVAYGVAAIRSWQVLWQGSLSSASASLPRGAQRSCASSNASLLSGAKLKFSGLWSMAWSKRVCIPNRLTRLSEITPSPTHRCIPSSPFYRQRSRPFRRLILSDQPLAEAELRSPHLNHAVAPRAFDAAPDAGVHG
jgi:hypothetical protein